MENAVARPRSRFVNTNSSNLQRQEDPDFHQFRFLMSERRAQSRERHPPLDNFYCRRSRAGLNQLSSFARAASKIRVPTISTILGGVSFLKMIHRLPLPCLFGQILPRPPHCFCHESVMKTSKFPGFTWQRVRESNPERSMY